MDRIASYQKIIREILLKQSAYRSSDMPNVIHQLITNDGNNVFLLLAMGWHGKEYIHNIAYHIEVKEGKVWIHEDRTDAQLSEELTKAGIPQEDIIFGYLNPYTSNFPQSQVA